MDEVTELRERVAVLERELTELRNRFDRTRVGGFRAMRDSRRCPACGGGALLHVPRATQGSSDGVSPLGIVHTAKWTGTSAGGVLESFTCRRCGLVELHVPDFEGVTIDGKEVLAIDPEGEPPHNGPFR